MTYRIVTITLVTVMFLAGCSGPVSPQPSTVQPGLAPTEPKPPSAGTVMVFAAGSLTQPFTELGALFETQHPGIQVDFNFQNANTLAQQIGQGAPADAFASAAEKYMTDTVGTGRINQADVKIFARNTLVIILPKNNPANIKALADLVRPGTKLVVGAKEGPQGIYVEGFLTNAAKDPSLSTTYKEDFYRNVVSYESSVNGVVTKVTLGEADAGIVFYSDSQGNVADKLSRLEIPASLNIEARYPIAALNDSQNPEMSKAFVDLVLSPAGQEVLSKYGFLAP